MADNNEMTVVPRALSIPEILSTIFMWIHQDQDGYWYVYDEEGDQDYGYGREGVLARCGVVNKLWHNEAMRYLWMAPTLGFMQNSLPALFANIDPARRQFYANYIKTATLVTVSEDRAGECDDALRGVAFPKLQSLHMMLDGYGDGLYVPRIQIHRLAVLEINPQYDVNPETFGMTSDEMDTILEQIPVRPVPYTSWTSYLIITNQDVRYP
jgi:hypothetical protein